ncbi:MAG: alpha/beta fold hydrolase [Phycisphaerales bacterium]|nr:alpha/beta fold hydrolase [Phycisphaerales bacterium]
MSTATINNQKIAYESKGSGRPVLLVHGFPLNREMWRAQIDALATSHQVIAPDLRGFGESDPPSGDVPMADHADDLAALLDYLQIDQPVAIAGFSMGGYVTFEFWRRHKDRVGSMMLVDTRADADSPEKAAGRRESADRIATEGPNFIYDGMIPNLVSNQTFNGHPELVKAIHGIMVTSSPAGVVAALKAMADRPDSRPLLGEINVPTAVIVGSEDAISPPAEMEQIANSLQSAEFCTIPDAGHMTTMENPAAVLAAMQKHLSA